MRQIEHISGGLWSESDLIHSARYMVEARVEDSCPHRERRGEEMYESIKEKEVA